MTRIANLRPAASPGDRAATRAVYGATVLGPSGPGNCDSDRTSPIITGPVIAPNPDSNSELGAGRRLPRRAGGGLVRVTPHMPGDWPGS